VSDSPTSGGSGSSGGPGSGTVRIAVLGCGAIGSLYAAHLARVPQVEVWAVDPWAEHMAAIAAHGLRVTGHAEFVVPVHALADAAVVSLQNGIGNEEVIAEVLSKVVRGSIVTAGHVTGPGVVGYDGLGDSWFGPFEPSPAHPTEIASLAALVTAGGLRTHALADARGPQWTKVVFNAATSPLAALTGLTVGQVCTDPPLRLEVDRLLAEALAVCAAAGITLTREPAESLAEAVEEAFWHRPSMLQDVTARRLTEVDVLNGGIAAEGRRVGVATPGHDAMVALLHGLERSWTGSDPGR
jgi:2-dehydropantoate 2-reductase